MTLDYVSIVSDEASRIVSTYELDRRASVPWSDRWTVATVARHVAATHHVVAEVVRGRPDADFGLFGELQTPPKDSPEFVEWFRSGHCFATRATVERPRRRRMLVVVRARPPCWLVGSSHGTRSRRPPFGYRCGTR